MIKLNPIGSKGHGLLMGIIWQCESVFAAKNKNRDCNVIPDVAAG